MRRLSKLAVEGMLVGVAGLLFGLAANFISPKGLALTRDYFPTAVRPPGGSVAPTNGASSAAGGPTDLSNAMARAEVRLKEKGLQPVGTPRAAELYLDPGYVQQLIVFIDARDDRHYQEGHIPGAYQFDHYRAEHYFATVLPACLAAETVVVYCAGGDCEDSEFAALTLIQAGIPPHKLCVYVGGIKDWAGTGHPVETGGRSSGVLRESKP